MPTTKQTRIFYANDHVIDQRNFPQELHLGGRCHPMAARGFSIIELLIAVTIVALLLLVAIPSYQSHTLKSNRQIAFSAIADTTQQLERYYAQHQRFDGFTLPDYRRNEEAYLITVETDASSYHVHATSIGKQTRDKLALIGIDHTGRRFHVLTADASATERDGWRP